MRGALVLALFGLVGCGEGGRDSSGAGGAGSAGSVGGTGGQGEPSKVEVLCGAYPAVWGAYMARCFGGDAEVWARKLEIPCGPAMRSERAGRLRVNEEKVAMCFDALEGGDCGGAALLESAGCLELLTGSVAVGEACDRLELWNEADECGPDGYCNAEMSGSCSATCDSYLQLHQPCTGLFNLPCAPGTQCDPDRGCQVSGGEGAGCSGPWHCEPHLYCAVSDEGEGATGTCQRRKTEGPCRNGGECAAGLRCLGDEGERTCVLPKAVGAPCTYGEGECAGQCSLDGVCEISADEGEPCGNPIHPVTQRREGLSCARGLTCDTEAEVCRPRPQPGAECSRQVCADVGDGFATCRGGKCVACD